MEPVNLNKWDEIAPEQREMERIEGEALTYAKDVWRRFRQKKTSIASIVAVGLLLIIAIFGPAFTDKTYDEQNTSHVNVPPVFSAYHINGRYYYVGTNTKLVEVAPDGTLLDVLRKKKDDSKLKRTEYNVDGETVYLSYKSYPPQMFDANENVLTAQKRFFNRAYPLGTDFLGRDILVRLIYGTRISLIVAFVAALVNLIIGVLYGSLSAYIGGNVDIIMMRVVDVISTIPLTLYVILLMVIFNDSGLKSIIIALGSVYWVNMARVVRGSILSLKRQEFVLAARTMGSSTWYILTKHLIPNTMGSILVTVTMLIPSAIFIEAFMSFIGLGITAPMASLGTMCNDALESISSSPYQLFLPSLVICIAMFAFNFIGDGLRDALDPQMRR